MKLRVAYAALLMLAAVAGAAIAGPLGDAEAANDRGDYATALRLFRSLAEQGNADAQYHLGHMYFVGQGIPQDYAEALKWYRLAADQGLSLAQFASWIDILPRPSRAGGQGPRTHVVQLMCRPRPTTSDVLSK
jgi:uncharacterized protein